MMSIESGFFTFDLNNI